ncbi:MAG: hypothetical protein LBG46_03060 [Elusimicrobiota bacterium]|jgi:hypothetical protein|nr:hypothetical protein [Elusimicrobiota bacterium]
MKKFKVLILLVVIMACGYVYWKVAIPSHRVKIQSELVMLGDLDYDNKWTDADCSIFEKLRNDPFSFGDDIAFKSDLNSNNLIDEEDYAILKAISGSPDTYSALSTARHFPNPRELYRYMRMDSYRLRPLYALSYPKSKDSVLTWLNNFKPSDGISYRQQLELEVFNEAVHFDNAYRKRLSGASPVEKDYAQLKLSRVQEFYNNGNFYELLLALIELVEDAETLTMRNQPDIVLRLLVFRDHIRGILKSSLYAEFEAGKNSWLDVLKQLAVFSKDDLGLEYDFTDMKSTRNFANFRNYIERTQWQYYKTTSRKADFIKLIDYAQNDRRYLRAVSRTSRRGQDSLVENHNLPMALLYRYALNEVKGNRKKAVGVLDETIRIPYSWIKQIPVNMLPHGIAFENFLLPGNKEDGLDKSRHWNVFGGICLYKSPQEAVDLAIRREFKDLKDGGFSKRAMHEFLRDMIANLNGMYHVMAIDIHLISPDGN